MAAPSPSCPTCGQPFDAATGLCPACGLGQPGGTPAWTLDDSGPERDLGLLLFEAEEALARGSAEKAVVLASRAVRDRPDSLTARALHERARRELLRGRRRERLEARVREAEGLLESGDAAGAERIVTSALKLIPSHPLALALFARLKERRQQATTAEAWAEKELERLTQARARRSLEMAQAEMAAGRERAALMTVRRGLRTAPDDPELLAMLRDIEAAMERAKAGHHAVHAQVRAGQELLAQGQIEESLKVLRAVLRADPENVRAQAAVQQVRKTWLRRQAVAAAAPPVEPPPIAAAAAPPMPEVSWQDVAAAAQGKVVPQARPSPPRPASAAPATVVPPKPTAAPPRPTVAPPPSVASPRPTAAPPRPTPAPPRPTAAPPRPTAVPPRRAAAPAPPIAPARGRALPVAAIVGGVALLVGVGVILVARGGSRPPPAPVVAAGRVAPPTAATGPREAGPAMPAVPGALAAAEPELRGAVEAVLGAYARALETADADLLAQARPDLGADERARLLAPFTGALNAATDLRVLDVKTRGDLAAIQVLRTDVIVGGPGGPRDPTEETLRFWRRRDEWVLVR